ncbi:MAG: ATP-binding protein [Bacillota bacterium]|nr:ATP-binding protein [Bacillota bacterium]
MTRLGLRGKLFLLVGMVLVPLCALQAVGIYRNFERRTQRELQASQELAQATSAAFINYLENLWDAELAMGTAITSGLLPPEGVRAYLISQLDAHPTVEGFSWVNPDGIVVEGTQAGARGLSCADREHVRRVVSGEDQAVSGLVVNRLSREPVFFVARGIRREGELLGLLVASIRPSRLGLVLPVERSGRSNLGLADHHGVIAYRSNDPQRYGLGKPLPAHAPGMQVLQSKKAVVTRAYRAAYEGARRMGAFILVPRVGWVAMASAQVDEVLGEAWSDAFRDIAVLLLVTVASLLGALFLANAFLRPLSSLQQAALAISRGDLKARVQLTGADELAVAGRAFDQMADRIQELESERSRFLEIAAAALRNPMATAKGACSLLRQGLAKGDVPPEEASEVLQVMEKEIDRLSSLLDEVLDAFCAHEGRLSVWREPVDLAEVIRRALEPFMVLDKDHRFTFEELGSAWVYGDARRLEDVMRQLVSNAVKFSPPGSEVKVRLELRNKRALIAVADQGLGIPEDELESIFHDFYRGSNLAGCDPGGIGLGLYICRSIVTEHGGRIWAESEEGRGSTFYVELPRLTVI